MKISRGLIFAGVSVFYAVGVAGHLLPVLLPWMLLLTPFFLLAAGAVVLGASLEGVSGRHLLLWLVPTLLVTFGLEVLGVATGWVFGAYHYSATLGTLVAGVPPVIGWNWVVVVLGVHTGVRLLLPRLAPGWVVLLTAVGCVLFDLLLEPVAIHLGYWVWDGGAVPLQNYAAWGAIAAAASWWASRLPGLPTHPILAAYVALQALFFLILGLSGVRA